jgi:hypothetical protein
VRPARAIASPPERSARMVWPAPRMLPASPAMSSAMPIGSGSACRSRSTRLRPLDTPPAAAAPRNSNGTSAVPTPVSVSRMPAPARPSEAQPKPAEAVARSDAPVVSSVRAVPPTPGSSSRITPVGYELPLSKSAMASAIEAPP